MLRAGRIVEHLIRHVLVAACGVVLLVAMAAQGPALAQGLSDYGIFGGGGGDAADPGGTSSPLTGEAEAGGQSRPVPAPASGGSGPVLSDYGVIAEYQPDPMLSGAQQRLSIFVSRLKSIAVRAPQAISEIGVTLAVASPTGRPGYFVGVLLFALLLLAIGRAATNLYAVYVARPVFVRQQREHPHGFTGKLPVLSLRVLLTVVGVLISLTVAMAIGVFFYDEHEETLFTVNVVFGTYALVQLLDNVWRMVFSPFLPEYRLPVISDEAARGLYRWMSWTTNFAVVSLAFCLWVETLGIAREVHVILTAGLMLVSVGLLLATVWRNHDVVSSAILGGRPRAEASWVAYASSRVWAPLVTAYLVIGWADLGYKLVLGSPGALGLLTGAYVTLIAGLIVYAATSYLIERVFSRAREIRAINQAANDARAATEAVNAEERMAIASRADSIDTDGDGDEDSAGGASAAAPVRRIFPSSRRPGMRTMEDLARRVASLFALGAGVYALLRVWGGSEVFENNPALDLVQDVTDILFIGYIAFQAARIWMDGKIEEEGGDDLPNLPGEGEGGGAGASRLATLLPLVRNFVLIVIIIAVTLTLAAKLGVNVAPLFAGAGIVGLAIGFGSQTLVRDILSGAFFLMDDAFRKGEYIDVGDVKGTVEKISLRSFQLRHHLGMLHTIPFGEIQFLTNFSRDWVMMKLPLRLTYDTDVEKVRKLIKKLGQHLLEDPEIGPNFLQPLKSQGVYMMEDSAMIIRVKFMTRPGDQWVIRKKVYAEIRDLFEREGIKFAHREVTVRIPDLDKERGLSEGEMKAIGAAARRVGDDVADELAATGTGGRRE